ncbi:MAG: Uncharacterized protein G01um101493_219 [Microgenomates group bacterium Gr01-1014_93]|nr:MAG: Uncharacterized protein G01um101493_219 [Microgenomates group bacterium Gr01-1014_93]
MLINTRLRIEHERIYYIIRELLGTPKILVKEGQQIMPEDIVARSTINPGFRSINLSKLLNVSPKDIKKYLKIDIGKKIFKDELLAFKQGNLFGGKKFITSPTDAVLESLDEKTGDIKLAFLPQDLNIPAAFYGFVEKIDKLRNKILIKTCATKIFGLTGSGKIREGIIKLLGKEADLLSKNKISDNLAGSIIVGGGLVFEEALMSAISANVSGIITGGINAKDFKALSGGSLTTTPKFGTDIGLSIVVLEGFGSVPIAEDFYSILRQNNGKFALIDGNRSLVIIPSDDKECMLKIKSTHLPLKNLNLAEAKNDPILRELTLGSRVRVIGPNFFGEQGKILSIDKEKTTLPGGFRVFLCLIEAHSRKFKIPVQNIEIIS